MKTRTGIFVKRIAVTALVAAMACPYAYAADIGKVTYVEGRVDVARAGSDVATPLREGDPVAVGDAIRTKSNSRAEVTFGDKSTLRLAQNTRIEVKDYVLDAGNKRKTAEIMVDRGRARTIIEKMPGLTEFNISTPNAKGTVRGSDVYTSFQAGSSSMLVVEGTLSVMNPAIPKEVLKVPAGSSVVVPPDETPKGMRPYMEFEKKLQDEDTAIPAGVARNPNAAVLKGAFTNISGGVSVTSKGSEKPHKATINEILEEGDTVETGSNGMAEISFENGNGVSLKQNTRITIIKLIQDPKTGQYENKFEASMGKVRARIEKLKETKSTFEVRTPTGVCGARGTLMYVEITPTGVRVFFEGGNGYLNSLISSMQSAVDAGQSAYADNSGNVSEPRTLSGEERERWGSGWGAGNGTEGYSAPDGSVGIYLDSGDAGMAGGLEIIGSSDADMNEPFADVPFPVEEGPAPGEPEEPVFDSNFNLTGDIFYFGEPAGTIDGSQGGLVGSFWNEEQKAVFISGGRFNLTDPAEEPFVWTINDGTLQSGSSVTATGGAFYGIAGGIGAGDANGGILEGLSKFIYIDPQGNVGIGGGKLIGEYSNTDGSYLLLSTLEGLTGTTLPGIYAEPGNIEQETSTLSFVQNVVDANVNMNVEYLDGITLGLYIPDYEFGWSIWGMKSYGTFSEPAAQDMSIFNFQIVGESSSKDGGYGDYWFGIAGGLRDTGSGRVTGSIRGMTLSNGEVGIFSGDLLGATVGSLNWEMVGLGQQETMGSTEYRDPESADEFLSFIEHGSFSARGYGSFDDGSAINAAYMDAETFNFYDQDWGIWEASLGGNRDIGNSNIFKIAVGGKHISDNAESYSSAAYIIATLNGATKDDTLTGKFKGVWLGAGYDNMIRAGTISGVVDGYIDVVSGRYMNVAADGYIDVVEGNGTWTAAAVGEWVEVTNLLTTDRLGITAEQLNQFVSIPITEVYSNILTGVNGGMSATANIALYQNQFANIWTMLLNGAYTASPGSSWNLQVGGGSDIINMQNGTWSENGTWTADVAGTVGGNAAAGQAGGTYGNGAFTGVGAGTWTPQTETPR